MTPTITELLKQIREKKPRDFFAEPQEYNDDDDILFGYLLTEDPAQGPLVVQASRFKVQEIVHPDRETLLNVVEVLANAAIRINDYVLNNKIYDKTNGGHFRINEFCDLTDALAKAAEMLKGKE